MGGEADREPQTSPEPVPWAAKPTGNHKPALSLFHERLGAWEQSKDA
jgi:hypothetical protein